MGNTQECQFELSKVLSRKMEEKSLLSFPKFCTIKKHMEYSWIKSFCLLIGANSCLCFHYLIIAMKYFLAFIIITSRAASKTACWTQLFALMNPLYKWIISILRSGGLCTSSITATEGGHFTPKSCWRWAVLRGLLGRAEQAWLGGRGSPSFKSTKAWGWFIFWSCIERNVG